MDFQKLPGYNLLLPANSTTTMSQTSNPSAFTQFCKWLFGVEEPVREPRRILATGKWREFQNRRLLLEATVKHPVTALSQQWEGELQAECAFNLMFDQGYINETDTEGFYLFIGAGRGSTQITILDQEGNLTDTFNIETGYPKDGEPNLELLGQTAMKVFTKYANNIRLIVGFDSIFHALKHDCLVIPDKGALPTTITTKGSDFLKLGYLTDLYKETPMIAVRNFVNKNGEARKISFATGSELLIDLGSGKASIVDPTTGCQVNSYELPSDWMTNDESLLSVGATIKKLLYEADEYEAMTSEEEEESEEDE